MLPTPPEGLRHWHLADAPALAAAWSDPTIAARNPPPPGLSPEEWILGTAERWRRRLAIDLVIEGPGSDDVAGEVGLRNFTSEPARAELGVWVAAPHRGRGLARHAVDTVTRWALAPPHPSSRTPPHPFWDADPAPGRGTRTPEREVGSGLGLEQVWARVDEENEAGQALFAGLGWQRLGTHEADAIWATSSAVLR